MQGAPEPLRDRRREQWAQSRADDGAPPGNGFIPEASEDACGVSPSLVCGGGARLKAQVAPASKATLRIPLEGHFAEERTSPMCGRTVPQAAVRTLCSLSSLPRLAGPEGVPPDSAPGERAGAPPRSLATRACPSVSPVDKNPKRTVAGVDRRRGGVHAGEDADTRGQRRGPGLPADGRGLE